MRCYGVDYSSIQVVTDDAAHADADVAEARGSTKHASKPLGSLKARARAIMQKGRMNMLVLVCGEAFAFDHTLELAELELAPPIRSFALVCRGRRIYASRGRRWAHRGDQFRS